MASLILNDTRFFYNFNFNFNDSKVRNVILWNSKSQNHNQNWTKVPRVFWHDPKKYRNRVSLSSGSLTNRPMKALTLGWVLQEPTP